MKSKQSLLLYWGNSHLIQKYLTSQNHHYYFPKHLDLHHHIKLISCGQQHVLVLTIQAQILIMGRNTKGQLGNDHYHQQFQTLTPIKKLQNTKIKMINSGWYHNVVLTETNQLYSWGEGQYGALGYNNSILTKAPKKINILLNYNQTIKSISCGSRYTFILTNINRVYAFGNNDFNQLGIFKNKKYFFPQSIKFQEKIEQIACGISHTLFLTKDGKIYATGSNNFGQLGLNNKEPVQKITLIPTKSTFISIKCGHHSCAISSLNQFYIWGTGVFGTFLIPTKITDMKVRKIYMGATFGFAETFTQGIYSWGSNISGELGQGDFEPRIQLSQIKILRGINIKSINCGDGFVILIKNQNQVTERISPPKKEILSKRQISVEIVRQQNKHIAQTIKIQKSQRKCLQKINKQLKEQNRQYSGQILRLNEQKYDLLKKLDILQKNKFVKNEQQQKVDQIVNPVYSDRVQFLERQLKKCKQKQNELLAQNKLSIQQNKRMRLQLQKMRDQQRQYKLKFENKGIQQARNNKKRIQQLQDLIDYQSNRIKSLQQENKYLRQQLSELKTRNYLSDITLSLSQFIPSTQQQFQLKQIKKNYGQQIQNYKKLLYIKQKQIRKHKKIINGGMQILDNNYTQKHKQQQIQNLMSFQQYLQTSKTHFSAIKNILQCIQKQLG